MSRAPGPTYICGICGFVKDEVGECPRCKLIIEQTAGSWRREGQALIDDVKAFLAENEDEPTYGQ